MSNIQKILFAALAACQLGFAAPQLSGCESLEDSSIRCKISGLSSDFRLKCGYQHGCKLVFPGYYIQDSGTDHPTLTTTHTSAPAEFGIVPEGVPPDDGAHSLVAQLMLTKSLFTPFEGQVRTFNSWLLTDWVNF